MKSLNLNCNSRSPKRQGVEGQAAKSPRSTARSKKFLANVRNAQRPTVGHRGSQKTFANRNSLQKGGDLLLTKVTS